MAARRGSVSAGFLISRVALFRIYRVIERSGLQAWVCLALFPCWHKHGGAAPCNTTPPSTHPPGGRNEEIPADSKWFAVVDIEDAFPSVLVNEKCRHLLVGIYNGIYYRCIGCPQGLAPIAPFFGCHLQDGFNHALDRHWTSMFSPFVDDIIVFATEQPL